MQPMTYQTIKNNTPFLLVLLGSFLVILSTFLPYMTVSFIITINFNAFDLSSLIGLILVAGGIISIIGAIKYNSAKVFDDYTFSEKFSLVGFIVQVIGFVLVFINYNNTTNEIDTTFGSGTSQYLINFGYGLLIGVFGAILVIIGYFLQRKERQKQFPMMQPPMIKPPMMQPPVPNVQLNQSQTPKFCINCGARVENVNFCTQCGTKVQ